MYKTVRFTDPKAVGEWDKQLGAFSVRPTGRELVEDDPTSAIFQINVDFTEEAPLFALQEYIAYANHEIQQCNRWVEKSQQNRDAHQYSFPWHTVKGDVRLEGVPPQPMSFELDRGRLLDLLVGHTIYNDPTVAVRELLQNAIDAVRFQHHLDKREAASDREDVRMGKVRVLWDPDQRILEVEDDGVGMDLDVIKYHLMRVGSSFYDTPQFASEHADFTALSRFGIGILTCFMISDDVEIVTRRDGCGYRLRMTSVHADYLLRELSASDPKLQGLGPHGTRVRLRVRATVDVKKRNPLDLVRFWVILPACEVEYIAKGQDPIGIGSKSMAEVLQNYIKQKSSKVDNRRSQDTVQPVIKQRSPATAEGVQDPPGHYELGFLVRSSLFPERSFESLGSENPPMVCVEGIRVAGELPGFSGSSIQAILSVRGARPLRTTVARSGLERDAEYDRLASVCSEMLFEHVRDEVARIQAKKGQPLSQASTAGRWLFSILDWGVNLTVAEDTLDRLYSELPVLIIETESTGSGPASSRKLTRHGRNPSQPLVAGVAPVGHAAQMCSRIQPDISRMPSVLSLFARASILPICSAEKPNRR